MTLKKQRGLLPARASRATRDGQWALLDFGDVVVHVFYHPVREFYDLEGLWIDAPRVPLDVPPDSARAASSTSCYGTLLAPCCEASSSLAGRQAANEPGTVKAAAATSYVASGLRERQALRVEVDRGQGRRRARPQLPAARTSCGRSTSAASELDHPRSWPRQIEPRDERRRRRASPSSSAAPTGCPRDARGAGRPAPVASATDVAAPAGAAYCPASSSTARSPSFAASPTTLRRP